MKNVAPPGHSIRKAVNPAIHKTVTRMARRMMGRAVYRALSNTLRAYLDYISSQLSLLAETENYIEAAKASLEKRNPCFKGK